MFTFLFSSALLVPLAWVVLNGPKPALFQLAGGLVALGWLAARSQLLALLRLWPFMLAGVVYAFCGYVSRDRHLVMYSHQMALLLMFYGLPAGLCLRRLAQGEQREKVAWAMLSFAIGMAIVSIIILRTPEVQRITGETRGTFQRTNGEIDDVIVYLKYFKITNIIIGVIPFTLPALAAFPLALTGRSAALRYFTCLACAVALYANILIATRTALMAAGLSSVCLLLLAAPHLPLRRWFHLALALVVALAAGMFYLTQNHDRVKYLIERFGEAGNDGRLGIWTESLALVQRFPEGGVAANLQSHSWAHNLFLDVGLTNGWIAIAAVVFMFVCAYFNAGRQLLRGGFFASSTHVLLLAWFISTSIAGMIQPPQPVFLTILHLAVAYFAPVRMAEPQTSPNRPPASSFFGYSNLPAR